MIVNLHLCETQNCARACTANLIPDGGALLVDHELRGAHPIGHVALAVDALDGVDGLVGQLPGGVEWVGVGSGEEQREIRKGSERGCKAPRENREKSMNGADMPK